MTNCTYCEESAGTITCNLILSDSPRIPFLSKKELGLFGKKIMVEFGEPEAWCEECYRERMDRFAAKGFDVTEMATKLNS
jgi:hypothetical protein